LNLAGRIRSARKAKGITQEELARRAGVGLNLINRIERGVVTDPHYSTLAGLAGALDTSIGALTEEAVPLGEAPPSGGIPKSLAELLERRGARTRHLADRDLSRAIRRLPTEDVIQIVREVREEVYLVGEDLARLHAYKNDPRAMGVVDQFSGQIWRAQIALDIRRKQEEKSEQAGREQEEELEQEGRALLEEARPLAAVG
jgi:transcriptional regulator with XRE-family HTH domain